MDAHLQPRYPVSKDCKMWHIFSSTDGSRGWKDWKVVSTQPASNKVAAATAESAHARAKRVVLSFGEARMTASIEVGSIGALNMDNEAYQGFYLFTWTYPPHALQEDALLKEYAPPVKLITCAIVCYATYCNYF